MGRWAPGVQTRLAEAAMSLYLERGFENVTVAEIAARAGVTERTFFRHYADKREVLFGGWSTLEAVLVEAVGAAPASASAMEAITAGLEAFADTLQPRRDFSQQRQAVINANTVLQERELVKLATLATTWAAVLRKRGVREPAASLSAEAGIAVFKVAYERWVSGNGKKTLAALVHESLDGLRSATAAPLAPSLTKKA